MRTGRSIRFIVAMLMLLLYGAGDAWAQEDPATLTANHILIQTMPSGTEGKASVSATEGSVSASVSGRIVTLTVTPGTDYKTKKDLIVVEKMINPTNRSNAPRRTPGIGTFDITSGPDGWIDNNSSAEDRTFTFTIPTEYDGAYVTVTFVSTQINEITSLSDLQNMTAGASYKLARDIDASGLTSSLDAFSGILDGNFHKILNLGVPLFSSVNEGTVKNLMLEDVTISQDGPVGAIAGTASGYSRIYNCGILPSSNKYDAQLETSYLQSSGGTNSYCGGLVGWLKDDSRVINCFSYANITGGTDVAGIVGHNEIASNTTVSNGKYANLRTAVVNCIFYGNLSGGTNTYPVYGGAKMANNTTTGINNYDFYRSEASVGTLTDYNCSWPAREEYLTQYEFHRNLLNSNRELCGWWVGAESAPSTLTTAQVQALSKDASLMAKWVLDPSIAPYPILKPAGYYPSPVNRSPKPGETNPQRIDPDTKLWVSRASSTNTEMKNPNDAPETDGRSLGKITVTIKKSSDDSGTDEDIIITAMDVDNNDFCYGKIQLPYYNSVFGNPAGTTWDEKYGGNYKDKVVVGWEITEVTGGTTGTLTKNWQTGYNFADRNCTNKDKERVFAQGGYYYVPYGVSAITITAKWATAIYLDNGSDHSYDRVNFANLSGATAGTHFAPAGTRPTTLGNGKTVVTGNIKDIIPAGSNVYENAIVLVGNHQYRVGGNDIGSAAKACTVMSADFDLDEEPDYSLIWQLGQVYARQSFCPIRFDFLPVTEMGLAMRVDGSTQYFSFGCYRPLGHFEVTETSLMHFGQFEFSNKNRTIYAPLILNGGIFDQYTKGTNNNAFSTADDKIDYIILGGNVRMPSFTPGAHVNSNSKFPTRHCAVNVMGGSIDNLYLTGNYNNGITPNPDNPHCYIDGGNFKQVAAAGKEGIDGDVFFNISHSIINEFYGGSTLADKLVTGNINVTINNSYVTKYCGGPKFGDMNHANNKTVTTNATGTTFGVYYGGGNGGTSYVQYDSRDNTTNVTNYNWTGTGTNQGALNNYTPSKYRDKATGYQADYELEIVNVSTGTEAGKAVFRTYFYSAQFSATNTGSITNNLTDCKILTNFYGGGNLGGVKGDVTSTLSGKTHVEGSAFGAGYSASIPEVMIYNKDKEYPTINVKTGIITPTPEGSGTSTTYTWTNKTSFGDKTLSTSEPKAMNVDGVNYLYTEVPLDNLGSVSGNVTLNIMGTTTVGKSVYGGGEESGVDGDTEVKVTSGTIGSEGQGGVEYGNVYGGGKGKRDKVSAGLVKGNTKVLISQAENQTTKIYHNVYGGGAYGSVGDFEYDASSGLPSGLKANTSGGKTHVYITGGTIGWNGKENGMVFGSSRGDVGAPGSIEDKMAWVYDTRVVIGDTTVAETTTDAPVIRGSLYGGGENGHNLHDAYVRINGGTIGVPEGIPVTSHGVEYSGSAYPYRGNVYGGGCGTDMYYSNPTGIANPYDGNGDLYNPLAGIVKGNAIVEITAGQVVRNVFGAGAMGSVGTAGVATTGKTTINISGGTIGVSGTEEVGDGNVFGAARGDLTATGDNLACVRTTVVNIQANETPAKSPLVKGSVFGGGDAGDVNENTTVNVSGGTVSGNIYGGGNLGYVGHITISPDFRSFTWKDKNGNDNSVGNADNTGVSTVNISGGTIGSNSSVSTNQGSVFGGGKGADDTFWCEKGMVYTTNVTISNATVNSHVYGGGEIARVESDTRVTIGEENATGEGFAPDIKGNIFGAGKGLATHGYSALVRGNTRVFIQGKTKVGQNVYGGGEIASVGKYSLNYKNMPVSLVSDGLGICRVTVRGNAKIGPDNTGNVFGGGKGIEPTWDETDKPKRLTIINGQSDWETFATEEDYLTYVQTLALATQTYVTIGGTRDESTNAITAAGAPTVKGSVYGGSESGFVQHHTFVTVAGGQIGAAGTEGNVYGGGLGLPTFAEAGSVSGNTTLDINAGTMYGSVFGGGAYGFVKGDVTVNINGGLIKKDVYGGGALANTNTANWDAAENNGAGDWAGQHTAASYTTTVNLKGGTIGGDAYGGGLGRLASGTEGQPGYVAPIAAMVYGNVSVNQGTANDDDAATAYTTTYLNTTDVQKDSQGNPILDSENNPVYVKVVNSGRIFGCNNLNGSPKGNVTVTVNGTVTGKDGEGNNIVRTAITRDETTKEVLSVATPHTYEVAAVYGGGNLANYTPAEGKVQVIIDNCNVSIEEVYGGGNAAKVPSTDVTVNGAHEIEHVFGGGNGKDKFTLDGGTTWNVNPGADIDGYANTLIKGGYVHEAYGGSNEKGTINGSITIDMGTGGCAGCPPKVDKLVGAGKNADVNGDLKIIMGCKTAAKTPIVYGGADNANVRGDVELTITSGNFGQVFGGNNLGGAIFGHIYLNIEETSDCEPIRIDELYLGGNQATYSKYGYYLNGIDANDRPIYKARTSLADANKPIKLDGTEYANISDFEPYDDPVLNVISCTSIGEVFGGGYGFGGDMYANPTVNINMIPGYHAETVLGGEHELGAIGNVYGGGNQADVVGNTTINIGTETTVNVKSWTHNSATDTYTAADRTVEGANITGNVYGGGKLANVGKTHLETVNGATADVMDFVDSTFVNIGTKYNKSTQKWEAVTEGVAKVLIAGHVFGGGKGEALPEGEGAFRCGKAMVTGMTNVHIGNGTVGTLENGTLKAGTGNVYGGGEVGRVDGNTAVMIGAESDNTSTPLILGEVYGAGKGVSTHGYSALVRGNTDVTVQGNSKVGGSVYGGGEIGSVGRYNIATPADLAAHPDVLVGMPFSLEDNNSGYCTVVVRDNAEVGPDGMQMKKQGGPDDTGYVFGGGKGVLPYEGYASNEDPWRVQPSNGKEFFSEAAYNEYYQTDRDQHNHEVDYFRFVESLALTTQTDVTIGGNAFIKGSVYGGSFNGHVQHDTHVTIADDCQIGQGEGITERYTDHYGAWPTNTENLTESWAECAHWDYDASDGAPFDKYAIYQNPADGKYYYDAAFTQSSDGASHIAKDGHTYYGNVFGGGSGSIPYGPGKWHRGAGSIGGNTRVDITGGHILTSVYGGNENTDVGAYVKDNNGQNTTTPVDNPQGKCVVNMTGGTVGVPRTKADKEALPVVGNVYGAGKGDQRFFFNTWTNVVETEVNISGDARIYGSVFGGGEDGHVMYDTKTNIGNVTIDDTYHTASANMIIGTTGTSYFDGNVFGGGRGFSGEAQTAGTVGGNVTVNISGGKMLGSVYGGGRLASVGTQFTAPDADNYGNFKEDNNSKTYGHVIINITGGTIGRDFTGTVEGSGYSGNVFGGSMGRLTLLNGTLNPIWPKMAQVKHTTVNISGDAIIKRHVYGGSELGTVRNNASVVIGGYLTVSGSDSTITAQGSPIVVGSVFGGGFGSEDDDTHTIFTTKELKSYDLDESDPNSYERNSYAFTPMQFAGCVGQNTFVHVVGGAVQKNVYGGGQMASVGIINCRIDSVAADPSSDKSKVIVGHKGSQYYFYKNMINHWDVESEFALSWPFEFQYIPTFVGASHVSIKGGRIGLTNNENKDNGDVYGGGQGKAGNYKDYIFCGNVGSAEVTIEYENSTVKPDDYESGGNCIAGAAYAGAENGHVMGDAKLTLIDGLVGHSIYGGGSGKGKFEKSLLKIGAPANSTDENDHITREIYSITAGKVFGNTMIEMRGGTVVRNVFGGGNMGSVGKGNYAGGPDDYSTDGYGETLKTGTNLWDSSNKYSLAFLNSGKCTVKITGGIIGYIDAANPTKSQKDGLPYGNVFGGCRGESAPDISEVPRYYYSPEFYLGYANETDVTIGKDGEDGPRIYGSVYGGGQDGHVRRDTHVKIYSGRIGNQYTSDKFSIVGTEDVNDLRWLHSGNVYGAGSGIGKYKFDFDNNGNSTGTHVEYVDPVTHETRYVDEEDYSSSAGSVTGSTKVEIKGGNIYRNVYGGGSLATIGAPKMGQSYYLYNKKDANHSTELGKQTLNEVIISGGQIGGTYSDNNAGNHVYGGHVFGASRGDASLDATIFSSSMFTDVSINPNTSDDTKSPVIYGSVFGGGEVGTVKGDVAVNMTGGQVNRDVYGGGALAHTQTANWDATANSGKGDWADSKKSALYTTTVRMTGGKIIGEAYGGGLGEKTGVNGATSDIEALVYGDVLVDLNGTTTMNTSTGKPTTTGTKTTNTKGCVVHHVFGCNNVNGSPQGDVMVHVFATQNKNTGAILTKVPLTFNEPETDKLDYWSTQASNIGLTPATIIDGEKTDEENINLLKDAIEANRYDVKAVYGGGDQAAYIPVTPWYDGTGSKTQVIIEGCSETNIETVYGGGNAAPVPMTNVTILEAHEIQSVFGGGNGKDDIIISGVSTPNPGADVGEYKNASDETIVYGTGEVNLNLKGGYIHEAYGGSNEKGKIKGKVNIDTNAEGDCDLIIEKLVGAGKNADIDGDLIMILGCKPTSKTPLIFAGADNADVNGNVELTITSGTFGKVFGGNNLGGAIKGHLVLNIEETGCNPIVIDDLYLGGYDAPYSVYGYYQPIDPSTHLPMVDENDKPVLLPRTAADYAITDTNDPNYTAPYGNPAEDDKHTFPYAQPVLNVISATSIGRVFGGGLGEKAVMHADPIVNINMIKGTPNDIPSDEIGTIGDVYGGGNEAAVTGSTTVNIATATTVRLHELIKPDGEYQMSDPFTVEGANITGNVYGGGNEADVKVNTTVNIGGGSIGGNVYGGGNLGYVGTITSQPNETGGTDYLWATGTGVSHVNISGGSVGPENMDPTTVKNIGNVFGAGKGKDDSFECEKAMVDSTNVTITNGTVRGSVYGGGEIGRVEHNAWVEIGEAGVETSTPDIKGNVFGGGAGLKTHGYSALIRGNSTVTVQGKATVGLNVYGGGEVASVGKYKVKKAQGNPADAPDELPIGMPYSLVSDNLGISTVKVKDGAEITGSLFGAGKGQEPEDLDWTTIVGDKTQMPKRMMNDYAQKNTYWEWYDEDRGIIWEYFDTEAKYLEFIETLALTTQTFVNVGGNAKVKGDVYGGSESGFVHHHTDVTIQGSSEIGNINGTTVTGGNVFGGGLGLATFSEAGRVSGSTMLRINGGTTHKSVYGGGAYGLVKKNVTVDVAGGEVDHDVYGGGALANTNTDNPDGVTNQYVTAVNLKGGAVHGAAYGGALGQKNGVNDIAAIVYGNVTVELNKDNGTCQIDTVFGCNNINGTPKGHALVHVFKTMPKTGQASNGYDVAAVFGGGNASDYEPIDDKQSTEVIVEGCDLSSIESVYGGGFGAATPATKVLIRGSKIIDKVFGGGYGAGENNPGANVGYKTGGSIYKDDLGNDLGSGQAIVQLMGGTIHYVYGGSNTKGDIREGSNVTNVDNDGLDGCCDYLRVDEIYGGGKSADMFGGTEIVLSCMPEDWIGAIYAGAESANVENDVSLTLTSGKFGRVFGGNKSGGKIDGSITINLEENPECDTPLIIGEVYGGGNEAAYSAYGYSDNGTPLQKGEAGAADEPYAGPWVNAKAFTSIGNIYGGGYGTTATVIGNPRVLINEVQDGTDNMSATGIANRNYAGEAKELPHGTGTMHVQLYPHAAGKMGVIGNVFGGGNAAKVIGDTSIEIGLGDSRYNESGKAKVFFDSLKDDPTTDVDERIKTVAGADIRGNVYGGGNQAEVTGNAKVQIGKEE